MISLKNTLEAIKSKIANHDTSIANKQDKSWTYLGTIQNSNSLSVDLTDYSEISVISMDLNSGSQSYGWGNTTLIPLDAIRKAYDYIRSDSTFSMWCGVDAGIKSVIEINMRTNKIQVRQFAMWGNSSIPHIAIIYAR